jgi:PAS domain S-box-containing protein
MKGKDRTQEQLINELTGLRKKAERFDLALKASQDGLWDWNIQTGELYWSPHYKKMLGYRDNEINPTFEKWESMLHPDDKKPTLDSLRNYLDKPGSSILWGEFRLRTKEGEYHWYGSRGQAVWDKDGRAIRMIGSMRDITDMKNLESELKKSHRDLEEKVAKRTLELTLANTKLMEAADFLENIIRSSLDSIAVVNKKGLLTRVNDAFLQLTGFSKAEVVGRHMSEFAPMCEGTYECTTGEVVQLHEEYSRAVESNMLLFQEKGRMRNAISYMLRKDNKIVPVEDNMVYLLDKEGKRIGAVAITRDITERRKAEKEIQKTKEYLENIFMTSVDGIIITDSKGRIEAVNTAAEKILSWSSDQLIGKHFNEMRFDRERRRVEGTELMYTLLNKGTISGVERTWKKPDGAAVVVEMNIALLKDDEGNMTGSVASIREITARKRAEEALRKSEEKYHNLIEHANDAIISVNTAGMIIGFNKKAEEMFDYSREEVVGKSSYVLIPHQDKELYNKALKQFAETGTGIDRQNNIFEGKAVRKGDEQFPVEYSYFTINIGGEFIATAILRDITWRKEEEKKILSYQEQLKSLTFELLLSEQKERQQLADFLHDEVGQQLFATRLNLEQLKTSLSSAQDTKTLDSALDNLYQVMNQTRSLTTELSPPILKQLGLEKALEWLAEQSYKKYNIKVTFEDDKKQKPLDDNAKMFLYQAVSELLTNVAKHARTKSAGVSIKRNTSKVEICVEDNGVGFLISGTDSSATKIEGLGLFRIKERLETLGGQLEIESQPNHGTRITLGAPLSDNV